MASFRFIKQNSGNANKQYGVEFDRLGGALGKKRQLTGEQMTQLWQGQPRNWPMGVDKKAPILPGDR